MMSGYKTYASCAAMILTGLGLILKEINEGTGFSQEGAFMIMNGFAFIFMRNGIKKIE